MSTHKTSDITKQLMVNAGKELLKKKPLNKISVREITEACGVNRQTFYYHFDDVYDMLKWAFHKESDLLLADKDMPWQDRTLALLHYLERNKDVCLAALNSLGRQYIKEFFYEDLHTVVESIINNILDEAPFIERKHIDFTVHYYTVTTSALIESWLSGEVALSAEELVDFLDRHTRQQTIGAIENALCEIEKDTQQSNHRS